MSCLNSIQTVSHSDGIPERFFFKVELEKNQTDNKKHALCEDDDTPTTIQDINPNLEASAFVWFISHDLSKFCHLLQS